MAVSENICTDIKRPKQKIVHIVGIPMTECIPSSTDQDGQRLEVAVAIEEDLLEGQCYTSYGWE